MQSRNRTLACLLGATIVLAACGKAGPASGSAATGQPAAPAVDTSSASATLGIAIYPGMETLMAPRRITGDKTGDLFDSAYKSADTPEKVAAFYRDELGKRIAEHTHIVESTLGEGMLRLQGGDTLARSWDITIRSEGSDTIVGIKAIVGRR